MFKHSLTYRLLSSSLILGWLVSASEEEQTDYITPSHTYRWSRRVLDAVLDLLYRMGDTLRRLGEGSKIGQNLLGFLGILIFCYFILDIAWNDYSLRRILLEGVIAGGGLSLLWISKIPGLWQGSLILSFFRWWGRTD